ADALPETGDVPVDTVADLFAATQALVDCENAVFEAADDPGDPAVVACLAATEQASGALQALIDEGQVSEGSLDGLPGALDVVETCDPVEPGDEGDEGGNGEDGDEPDEGDGAEDDENGEGDGA